MIPRITAALARLNRDELEVVAEFVAKLEAGKQKHGPLDLASDTRDLLDEWKQEAVDGAAYAIMAVIKTRRARERGEPGCIETALRELAAAPAQVTDRSFKAALIAESVARGPLPADWPGPLDLSEHDGGDV